MTADAHTPIARGAGTDEPPSAPSLSRLDLERLFPPALRPAPALELADGMCTAWDLLAVTPEGFSGTLDLTACNSVLLLEQIRRARPDCLVAANLLQADLLTRFVCLAYVAAFLEDEPQPYHQALARAREHVLAGARRRVRLGGPAPEKEPPPPVPRCRACSQPIAESARFCSGCGSPLAGVAGAPVSVVRDLRALAPRAAPRDADFKVHIDVAPPGAAMPDALTGEREATTATIAFESRERAPEATVQVRSHLFAFGPPSQTVRLDALRLVRVSFTGRLPTEMSRAAGPGQVWLDMYCAGELVASASFSIDLAPLGGVESARTQAPQSQGAPEEHAIPLTAVTPIADAIEQQKRMAELAGALPVERLPEPLAAPFRAMARAASPFENAGWIPYVLEAFFRYHLALLGEPFEPGGSPRQTLGLLRSRFEALVARRSSHPALAHLQTFRQQTFVRLMNSLVDYRNRVWGHAQLFPSAAQCAELYAAYRPKLDAILRVAATAADPAWLVATDGGSHVGRTTPAEPATGGLPAADTQLAPNEAYLASAHGWLPLGQSVRWRECPRGREGGHFELFSGWEGEARVYRPVPGACERAGLDQLLPA